MKARRSRFSRTVGRSDGRRVRAEEPPGFRGYTSGFRTERGSWPGGGKPLLSDRPTVSLRSYVPSGYCHNPTVSLNKVVMPAEERYTVPDTVIP